MPRPLGSTSRVVAGVLALTWIGAGVAAIGLGIRARDGRAVVLGILAEAVGLVWWRVARSGRYLAWPSARFRK